MTPKHLPGKVIQTIKKWWIYVVGFGALIWFLVRVVPKPSRAAYPCQRAAFPIASAFVLWIAGIFSTTFLFKKARAMFAQSRYVLAGLLLTVSSITSMIVLSPGDLQSLSAGIVTDDDFTPIDAPNDPMGTGRGIYPGRVVWSYDTASTSWTGEDILWWSDASIDSVTVKYMLSRGIQNLTGASSDTVAWDSIFRYFNKTHDKGDTGYSSNEKIAIKVNWNMMKKQNQETNAVTVAPQVVLALLKQLVYNAGVPASAITFYDISRHVPDFVFNPAKEEFPDVHFIDNSMGENGREPFSMDINTVIDWSSDSVDGQDSYIPGFVSEADYIINLGSLKAHKLAGITINAKNHFGTYASNAQGTSGPVDAGVHPFIATSNNLPQFGTKREMGTYNALVDIMGHRHLGEKTLLFVVDALHNSAYHNTSVTLDCKMQMAPFNGDWMSSLFLSFDGVAIESVGLDFLRNEPGAAGAWIDGNVDNYLHEAALAHNPPSGTLYDPEGDGSTLTSLGVHEHWNDHINKQYSRNLGADEGIELFYVDGSSGATDPVPPDTIPSDTIPSDTIPADTTQIDPVRIPSRTTVDVAVFPNPVSDVATLALNSKLMGEFRIEIITITARRASSYRFVKSVSNQHFQMDLSDLVPGYYFCRVSGQGFSESISFIKQ